MKTKEIFQRILTDLRSNKWAILGLSVYWIASTLLFDTFCPMKILTGLPCPACGMTRAIFLLFIGRYQESYDMHPMAILWILLGGYVFTFRYLLGKRAKGAKFIGIVLCILMVGHYFFHVLNKQF